MARSEVTARKPRIGTASGKKRRLARTTPTEMFSISSFCAAHGISESFFHKLRGQGLGPRLTMLGARVFITHESAAAWRAEREAATTTTTTVTEVA
jgi:hypothetical protein